METYLFKTRWCSDSREEEVVTCGTVAADNYAEAVDKIDRRFSNPIWIFVTQMFCCDGFTFLEDEEYERLIKEESDDND